MPDPKYSFALWSVLYLYLANYGWSLPSGVKQIDNLLPYYCLSTESQKQFHPGVNVYLSAEVEVGKGKKFIVTFHIYTTFVLEIWGSC